MSLQRPLKRVMLIFPPMFDSKLVDTMVCPPMGIAYLGAYIREMVTVRLLDCVAEGYPRRQSVDREVELVGLSETAILDEIRDFAPDMVGISCLFSSQILCVQKIAQGIKRLISSEIIVVTGGTHPSFLPEQTLAQTAVDYIVLGEGELGLAALIEAHNKGTDPADIDGLAFRKSGQIHVRPRTSWITDLDALPFPAHDLLPLEKYFEVSLPMGYHWRKRRNVPLVSSRGCPRQCPFCSSYAHWGKRFRTRSAENVLAEIEYLQNAFGVQEIKWQDDNLTADAERAKTIFRGMVERGLAMPWNTPNGIALWTLDQEMVQLMKQSGCYEVTLAVESGDPDSFREYVRKPFTLAQVKTVARMLKKHGLTTQAYFIIGFPEEPLAQIKNSMRFARKLGVDYLYAFVYTPLPGSRLWQKYTQTGLITDDYSFEAANHFLKLDDKTTFLPVDELYRIQIRAYLANMLKLPFRNPKEFLLWYGRKIFTHPVFIRDFFVNVWTYRSQAFTRNS